MEAFPEERSGILAGTLSAETAVRSSYESAVKIGYDAVTAQSSVYAAGVTGDDLVQAISQFDASKPQQSALTAQASVE
jgi:hypothetical protein